MELATVAPHRKMLVEMLEAYARARAALAGRASAEGADAWMTAPTAAGSMTAAMDPLGAELAFGEAQALLAAGELDEAMAQLEKAVDFRPDQAAYHAWLGWALWRARGEAAKGEARDRLDHALALDPDSTEAHALMGSFLCAAGERAAARTHLERTLALRPEQREPIEQLVGIYLDSGEPDQAEKLYRRADRRPRRSRALPAREPVGAARAPLRREARRRRRRRPGLRERRQITPG